MWDNPSTDQFQALFYRDFPYNTDPNQGVTDGDITRAFTDVNSVIDPCLFGDQASYTNAYLLLTAHFLVTNIRMSSQGLAGGPFSFLEQSSGAGAVSRGFAVPPRVLENPVFAAYCSTQYGARYLVTYVLPNAAGQMFSVQGTTQP